MRKKFWLLVTLIGLLAILSGCTDVNEPITEESEGIWNKYFVFPVSMLITYFAELFNENYGLAIVIVTILVRLVLLPLNVKQLKSSKAMQDIQPKLKELQQKYSSKDANTQQKLQQETMALFQKNGVNPLAGCLPIFIQMPILIAMYHAIMRTESIKTHSFLWFELGAPDPFFILPIIAAAATWFQQKLMMSGSPAAQNPQMMVMLYVMPIMIGVFAIFFPAALALYWVVGNIFMVAQTLFIRKPMMADKSNGGDKK
ncbi:MAG: YidC family membrane integrase SpoIIIJ [Bacillota bacterium]|uniref:Membrane protein insertase YidC n=1 Tax=Virgibacillus salarius TaxID=447199 RepID=A0A941DW64_9BACI|nr:MULTISPECIES: YidC family membrane integrase SpoIIIJ [Bacillaceae]NAZ09531.1 YidC family membrane integrase SpoIIIJ [Agaribacter marinus]MBR7796821.1 YidC family membrane integrase SpoIIIJ [Virgibacillus salarius]MCC2250121.1 YidC family membrane integrase SpoIIIJ [Virgibacillus sp. AGTR]MDY7045589.1 YidC family membrane integrase SpoIIIJ [Virgibacillus sp. M23]QRZ19004.1 YidC family membrane integrase SpoIIIJ [Virgibacillus sp. AGTR]